MPDKIEKFVIKQESPNRLDKYLVLSINNITRSKIQHLIKDGCVSINGKTTDDASYKTKLHDEIIVVIKPTPVQHIVPKQMDLDIVYEDEHLAVINKAAGVTTHPGAGNHNDTLVNGLMAHFKNKLSTLGGDTRPGIVHRLDKNTTGLILIAKNDVAHANLAQQLERREVKRIYYALVWGVPNQMNGTIAKNIGRSRQDRKKMQVLEFGGKVAVTHYKVLEVFLNLGCSLIECELQTGRTHQIRVHMKHLGHAIAGDPEYSNIKKKRKHALPDEIEKYLDGIKRQMLHAKKIKFMHPVTNKPMDYEIELPYDMASLIQVLRSYIY